MGKAENSHDAGPNLIQETLSGESDCETQDSDTIRDSIEELKEKPCAQNQNAVPNQSLEKFLNSIQSLDLRYAIGIGVFLFFWHWKYSMELSLLFIVFLKDSHLIANNL